MTIDVGIAPRMESQQRVARWERLAPLSGVAFFVLLLISSVLAGSTPTDDASGTEVLSTFGANAGAEKVSSPLAVVLLVLFASRLDTHYPSIVGIAVLMFAACGAILRPRALPAWLGAAALPVALLAIAPPSLVPLIATGVWMAAASLIMFRRGGPASGLVNVR